MMRQGQRPAASACLSGYGVQSGGVAMMFRLGLKTLAAFCHQMGTMLEAGLPIRRALSITERGKRAGQKQMYGRIGKCIDDGDLLSEALEKEGRAFPVLFRRLIKIGETAGGLDRIFKGLGDYFAFLRSVWGRLLSGMVWPVFEYWAMVFVLALVSYIGAMTGGLNLGFTPAQALIAGTLVFFAPIVLYFAFTRLVGGTRMVHEIILKIPVFGGISRTMALARFSWAMEIMTSAGVRILDAITWSLEATANGAFEAKGPAIVQQLKDGAPFHECLERSGLFPIEYIEMVHVAQESGSMPDIFARLARNYFEKMEVALKVLARVMGIVIWIVVACIIIFFIFRIAGTIGSAYQGAYEELGI